MMRPAGARRWLWMIGVLVVAGCQASPGDGANGSTDLAQTLGQFGVDFARALFAAWVL